MTHSLGVYWAPGHQRQADIDYMRQLQPPAIRVLDPDVNQIAIAYQTCPNALILPRDWSLSEQHNDVRVDPERTGKRHAQEWRQKIDQWRMARTPLPPDNQIIVVGINEPQVWSMLPQVVTYTVAMLDECTRLGLRASALNLSVGWPANTGEGTPPDWTPYKPIEAAIKHGNHYLTLHSYWYKSGPQDGAGWWAWRHHACPWDVPIIIGEAGVDLYVDMERWANDGKPNRGWRGNISPDQYAAQIEQYARGCDRRVVAILPFLTDYRSNNWESFDTLEAHSALLARKDNMIPQAQPPSQPSTPPATVHIPTVSTGTTPPAPGQTYYVRARDGVNLRVSPVTGEVLAAAPYGTAVQVLDHNEDAVWLPVRYQGMTGWMFGDLLSATPLDAPTQPAPSEPVATGILDPRVAQAILQIESGGRTHGENGLPLIRFEAHIFENKAGKTGHFRYDKDRPWVNQEWRRSPGDPWKPIHTGKQADEYEVLEFAKSINADDAYQSISMGAGQLMGFHHLRVGFQSAEAMYNAFQSAPVQTIAFINFFLSDPALVEAMRKRDWREIAKRYNGSGQADYYSNLLKKAYEDLA